LPGGLAPHDRHAVRTALRATRGQPGPLLLVVLALSSLLASREQRRRDGPATTQQVIQTVRTASAVGTASRFSPRSDWEGAPRGEPVLAVPTRPPSVTRRVRAEPTCTGDNRKGTAAAGADPSTVAARS